jgi:hypothetical protein
MDAGNRKIGLAGAVAKVAAGQEKFLCGGRLGTVDLQCRFGAGRAAAHDMIIRPSTCVFSDL